MYKLTENMIQELNMTHLEKEVTENLGRYIESPWSIIESYFKDRS